MAMLSIPSYKNDDPNYRYKMPRLVAKVEGRGNGIRTNIVNMGDIARALKRPPDYPTKFCGHELGSQSKFDPSEGKAIVNGSHTQQDLQLLIDKFIDKFVLCEECKLPEIDLLLKKNRVAYRCNACGNQGLVDNQHKLATFILKNPPDGTDSTLGTKNKKTKSELKKTLKSKPKGPEEDIDLVQTEPEDSKKLKKHKKKKKTDAKETTNGGDSATDHSDSKEVSLDAKSKKNVKGGQAKPEEDSVSDKPSAAKQKSSATRSVKKKSTEEEDKEIQYDSPEVQEIIGRLSIYFKSPSTALSHSGEAMTQPQDQSNTVSAISPSEFFNELRLLQVTQSFNHRIKLFIALNVFFSQPSHTSLAEQLDQYIPYLKHITQGIPQRDILTVFEDYVALNTNTTLDAAFYDFPYTVQKLYNADLLDEEGIIKHYSKSKAKEPREAYLFAKKVTEPLIHWLRDESGVSDSEGNNDEGRASPPESLLEKDVQNPTLVVPSKQPDLTQQ